MATGKAYMPITPARRTAGFPEAEDKPEGASQTYRAGVPVIISSNRVAEAGAGPAVVYGFSERAGQNGTAGQYTARVFKASQGVRFTASLTGTLPAAPIGTAVGLVKDGTSGQWYLDSGAGTKQCHITAVDSHWVPGTDTNAEVEFVVDYNAIQY